MPWTCLFVAGLFEVGWATGMKYSHGLTRAWISVGTVVASIVSFVLLALAMKTLPLGTSYAIWTGIGVLGTAILGILLFNDSTNPIRLGSIALIFIGIIGLRLAP